ncbi:hypothetical protein [Pelagerythrobacter sp.]|uniref:hypothetical protein n=1 Tax=Pelagerythrobacter sp. TaxID=2800702 RepID=UPI0035B22EA4
MIRPLAAAFALALALPLGSPTAAFAASPADSALAALQRDDARLLAAGWRLATGNARFCTGARPAVGLLLQDMAGYADPAAIRAAAGIEGEVAVQAVAPSSPAAAAGLRPNREVAAVDGATLAGLAAEERSDWRRLAAIHAMIERSLAEDGAVALAFPDGGELTLRGVPACPSRFEMMAGERAVADGARVAIGREFAGLAYPEGEFAAAVAHELAHNLLGHPAWLDSRGRKRRDVRLTEREADRLMPWLLANAGYDPAEALHFMRRWGPEHGGGLFRKRTHDGWDERAEAIAAELPRVAAARGADGSADWARLFVREIPPDTPR